MEHPIGNMMQTTMENIKDMVDVNTVIGDPVSTADGVTVIPVSKVSFGFVAGGGEYGQEDKNKVHPPQGSDGKMPFAGGSGAGVSVQPVGFLVVGNGSVKMLPAQPVAIADRMVELLPQMVEDVRSIFRGSESGKNNKYQKIPSGQSGSQGREEQRDERRESSGLNQMNRGAPSSYDDRMS